MGYGTGVLRAYYAVSLMRGLTVGVAGASSLYIAQRSGAPQNVLVAARGVGLIIGPAILSRLIGKMVWSGESQSGFAIASAAKVAAELVIPRAQNQLVLYAAFLIIGLAMAVLDTSAQILITRVHKEQCGLIMLIYCAVYGIGCMVAPFITIRDPFRVWDLLALIDLVVASSVGCRRLVIGKPRNWKAKVRGNTSAPMCQVTETPSPTSPVAPNNTEEPAKVLPSRVLHAGMAFVFLAQTTETAMSCWAFTFAATTLHLGKKQAALFPSSFYLSFTTARGLVLILSTKLLPSTIAQVGTMLTVVGSLLFYSFTRHAAGCVQEVSIASEADPCVDIRPMLACLALVGAGSCPLYPMMLGSVRQHGDMDAKQQGWFMSAYSSGITAGMFLPGLISLPCIEVFGSMAMFLILSSHIRYFPLLKRQKRHQLVATRN